MHLICLQETQLTRKTGSMIPMIAIVYIVSYLVVLVSIQPLKLLISSATRKASNDASKKTIQRRASAIESYRYEISGGTVADYKLQQLSEIRRLGREERRDIVSEAGLSIEIPPDEGLAMKSELGIPWNKIRNMRRFVNTG